MLKSKCRMVIGPAGQLAECRAKAQSYYHYYAAFNVPCVGHKDGGSQAVVLVIAE